MSRTAAWVWQTLWRPGQQNRLELDIADCVLVKRGDVDKWIFTSKNGTVLKKSNESAERKQIHARFIQVGVKEQRKSVLNGLLRNADFHKCFHLFLNNCLSFF